MNELPKQGVKRSSSLVWRLLRWLFLVVGAITLFLSGYFLVMQAAFNQSVSFGPLTESIWVYVLGVAFLGWLLQPLLRLAVRRLVRASDGHPTLMMRALGRILNRRMIPCYLFCLAGLATLIGLFYAVEDWRGKRAWEKCRRELEAKGAVLDWNALIPPQVPDGQNIFKAPKMTEWFVRNYRAEASPGKAPRPRDTNAPFSLAARQKPKDGPVLVAEVRVVTSKEPPPQGKADAVLRFDDPVAHAAAAKLFRENLGACAEGATGYGLISRPVDQVKPVHLVMQADTVPTTKALDDFLSPSVRHFQVTPAGSNAFRVWLNSRVYAATDYLALSEPAVPDLDLLRKALERPWVRMDGDYQRAFQCPIPNFVMLRTVAQLLGQRAQCYLLLGQPEAAWHELELVRDMCRMLEAKPASNCPTLVAAMIDVAISGLYVSIIQDGLRLRVWREPELAAMQKQLMDISLLPLLRVSFNAERAAVCRTFEITPPPQFYKWFGPNERMPGIWARLTDARSLLASLMPYGWVQQNMCANAIRVQLTIESFDVANDQIQPREIDGTMKEIQTTFSSFSPYTWLAAIATPNFAKAIQRMAQNQTLANEAFIACGLERYRLAHGQYPDTLDALVPQFAAKLPHDIIGGKPLHYHRTADGRFVLYSVGWNGKDDGGVAGKAVEEGDWVWQ